MITLEEAKRIEEEAFWYLLERKIRDAAGKSCTKVTIFKKDMNFTKERIKELREQGFSVVTYPNAYAGVEISWGSEDDK